MPCAAGLVLGGWAGGRAGGWAGGRASERAARGRVEGQAGGGTCCGSAGARCRFRASRARAVRAPGAAGQVGRRFQPLLRKEAVKEGPASPGRGEGPGVENHEAGGCARAGALLRGEGARVRARGWFRAEERANGRAEGRKRGGSAAAGGRTLPVPGVARACRARTGSGGAGGPAIPTAPAEGGSAGGLGVTLSPGRGAVGGQYSRRQFSYLYK